MSERSIFLAALDIADMAKRSTYLDQACGNDAALRKHIEELVAAEAKLGGFLARPHLAPEATEAFGHIAEGPGTVIGPYKLREQIGEGGFGVVYVAEQEKPVRRKVALKIIKPGMDTKDVIARFEAERQALALMDHPNVARVLDAGATESGRPYFVMELVHGVPITEFCDKNKLPTRDRLLLFADVCRAVQHAHQKGIIHRDLKPSNIMVTLHDGKPVAKVIDFGVSKALSQQLTEKSIYTAYGQMIGTPSYMSPEQAEMSGLGIDTRSDIYSLGVLLYELLTGKTPLDAKRLREGGYGEMMRMIRDEEPPRPSLKISTLGEEATTIAQHRHTDPNQLRRSLRGELDWIVMKCLEKDRARRYETANSLARDVERYLQDEPVEGCPPSATYRLRKFAGKHKTSLAVAIAFLGLLLTGVAVSTWQRNVALEAAASEKRAKEAETKERERAESNAKAAHASEVVAEQQRATAEQQRDAATQAQDSAIQEKNNALAAREELRHTLYAAEMNLVQTAWENQQYDRAAQLLEQQRQGDSQDLRGFEWHYWKRQLSTGRLRSIDIPRLNLERTSPAFSRDRTRFAAIVRPLPGLLTVLEVPSGRQLLTPISLFPDHQGSIRDQLLSMNGDGSRVAVALSFAYGGGPERNNPISIRDCKTGNELCRIDNSGVVSSIAMSPDGERLAVAYGHMRMGDRNSESLVKIWNASTGELEQTLPPFTKSSGPESVHWSPTSAQLAWHSEWHSNAPADKERLIYERLQCVDATSGEELWKRESSGLITSLRVWGWSPDDRWIVVAQAASRESSTKPTIQLCDSASGQPRAIFVRPAGAIIEDSTIDFSPDGRQMAVSSDAHELYLWDISQLSLDSAAESTREPVRVGKPHVTLRTVGHKPYGLRFSADGSELYSVGESSLVAWNPRATGHGATGPELRLSYAVSSAAISSDATKVAINDLFDTTVWDLSHDLEQRKLSATLARAAPASSFPRVKFFHPAFSFDGRRLACFSDRLAAERQTRIIICDAETGQIQQSIPLEQDRTVDFLRGRPAFRPDGKQIAVVDPSSYVPNQRSATRPERRRLLAWDIDSGKQAFAVNLDAGEAWLCGYTPDGSSLVVALRNQQQCSALFYDAATGALQQSVPIPGSQSTFWIDVRHNLMGRNEGPDYVLYELATGQEKLRLPGQGNVDQFTISPDGSRIALGGMLNNLSQVNEFSLWSQTSRRRLLTFRRQGKIQALTFSPDGHRLAAAFTTLLADKPIQIWDATPLPEEP